MNRRMLGVGLVILASAYAMGTIAVFTSPHAVSDKWAIQACITVLVGMLTLLGST